MTRTAGFFLVAMSSVACGSSPQAELDAGVSLDSAFETIDGGLTCLGVPAPCADRAMSTCSHGCRVLGCSGAPAPCAAFRDRTSCSATETCVWTGSDCTGSTQVCTRWDQSAACRAAGCDWDDAAVCEGTPVPCATLGAECSVVPGCGRAVADAGDDFDARVSVEAPRLIAPLSTSMVTSRRPTVRWETTAAESRVEVCVDRACSSVLEAIDVTGTSGRPTRCRPVASSGG